MVPDGFERVPGGVPIAATPRTAMARRLMSMSAASTGFPASSRSSWRSARAVEQVRVGSPRPACSAWTACCPRPSSTNFDYGLRRRHLSEDGDPTGHPAADRRADLFRCHVWRGVGGLEMRDEKGPDFKSSVAVGDSHQAHVERCAFIRAARLVSRSSTSSEPTSFLEDSSRGFWAARRRRAHEILRADRERWARNARRPDPSGGRRSQPLRGRRGRRRRGSHDAHHTERQSGRQHDAGSLGIGQVSVASAPRCAACALAGAGRHLGTEPS